MQKAELIRSQSDSELAHAVARTWLDELAGTTSNRIHCVALSGGRIAKTFFAAVVQHAKSRHIPFSNVHFFWADERCVPPFDAESNFRMAQELLLAPLDIASQNVHRIRGEQSPADAARDAAVELCRVAPPAANGLPMFDVVFLGMGEDAHVASLFPGEHESVMNLAQVYRPVVASKPPPNRITLGYGIIAAARHTWVLASGKGKEQALRDSLAAGSITPLGRVIRTRTHTRIYTDIQV